MLLVVVKIVIEAPGVIPSTKKFGIRIGSDDRKRSAILLINSIFLVAVVNKINVDVDFADVEVDDFPFERQEMIGMR
jgi:hypothetical protein